MGLRGRPSSCSSASRIGSRRFTVTPIEPKPCTLEWPRIGIVPAPGRATLPVSTAVLAIACTLAVPLAWWVMPIAQANTTALHAASRAAVCSSSSRLRPQQPVIASQLVVSICSIRACQPSAWAFTKSRAMAPRSSRAFCSPRNTAVSEPGIGCRNREAISLPPPSIERIGKAGEPNLSSPASSTGLITITVPPRSRRRISSFISRGWFAGALEPTNTTPSACCRLSRFTIEVPLPNTRLSPMLEGAWQRSEQSARLLEPRARSSSCSR